MTELGFGRRELLAKTGHRPSRRIFSFGYVRLHDGQYAVRGRGGHINGVPWAPEFPE